ncbi:MAG: hypothetical protein EXS27_01625 [Pedosphaera sp.]|nr:hypothetical protein [Pedosphaera sp.]
MNRLLLCALLVALPLAACKRKPAAPEAQLPAAPPNPEVDLKALNEAVRAHVMGQLKEPTTLEDLVKTGFIKRLPAPPPGKKYVLDAKKASVLLVDQ